MKKQTFEKPLMEPWQFISDNIITASGSSPSNPEPSATPNTMTGGGGNLPGEYGEELS